MLIRYTFLILLSFVSFSLYLSFLSVHLKGQEEQKVSFYSKIDMRVEHVLATSNKQYLDTIKKHSKTLSTVNESNVLDWKIFHQHLKQGDRDSLSYHALYAAYLLSINELSPSMPHQVTEEKSDRILDKFLKNELLIQ